MKHKTKKKQRPLWKITGDIIYSAPAMKKSQNTLIDNFNMSLRKTYSDISDLVAKTYMLVENGEATRSELIKLSSLEKKLFDMVDDFKYSFMR